jgi:type II secretory pathway pseudopilin PulG
MRNATPNAMIVTHRRRRGLTLTDVLVSVLILGLLAGVVLSDSGLMRAREAANRVKCAANLKMTYQAMYLYSNENKGAFPRTVFKVDAEPTQYTGVDTKDPFGKDSTIKPNDVTAAIWLIVRTQDITPDVFTCPSTDAKRVELNAGKTSQDLGNFKSEDQLSYSIANPYPSRVAIETGYKWNNALPADFAMAADMNPGNADGADPTTVKGPKDANAPGEVMRKANSLNHRGVGQNVLYGDGHIQFEQTPFCGIKRDNIYTVSPNDAQTTSDKFAGAPGYFGDSILLPVATASPHKTTPEQEEAAALKQAKEMLPKFKQQIAEHEAKEGATPEVQRAKQQVEMIEKEIAEAEKRQQK